MRAGRPDDDRESPTARSPTRCTAASARTWCAAGDLLDDGAQLVQGGGVRRVAQVGDRAPAVLARTVPTNTAPPAPGSATAA